MPLLLLSVSSLELPGSRWPRLFSEGERELERMSHLEIVIWETVSAGFVAAFTLGFIALFAMQGG